MTQFTKKKHSIVSRTAPRLLVTDSATLGRTPITTPHHGLRELRLEVGLLIFMLIFDISGDYSNAS